MAIVEDEVRNESEEENEIEVVVEEDDGDRDSDDSEDDDDDEVLEKKVVELEKRINSYECGYDIHMELINALWRLSELDRWRSAFERLQLLWVIRPEHWLMRLQTEVTLAHSAEAKEQIINLFHHALVDCYSIPILSEWCTWSLSSGDTDSARGHIDEVIRRAGADPLSGKRFWDAKLELEKAHLETLTADSPDYKSQQERVLFCLEEIVSRPLLHNEEAWQPLEELAAAMHDQQYVDKVKKQHEVALELLQKLTPYEDKLLTVDNAEEKYTLYQEYIDAVTEYARDDKYAECDINGILKVLYDRGSTECMECPKVQYLLQAYARHVHRCASRYTYCRVLDCCVRRNPRSSTFWTLLMQQAERDGKPFDKVKDIFECALSKGMETFKDAEQLWLSYLEYVRRHTDFGDDQLVQRLRQTFRICWDSLIETWGAEANDSDVPLFWARLEYRRIKEPAHGKNIIEEIFRHGENKSLIKYWEAFIGLEMEREPPLSANKKRDLFRRALKFVTDYPPTIVRMWTDYERDYGALEDLKLCYDTCETKLKKWREDFQAMKVKMTGKKQKKQGKKLKNNKNKKEQEQPENKQKRKAEVVAEATETKRKKDADMEVEESATETETGSGLKRTHAEDSGEVSTATGSKRQRTDDESPTDSRAAAREACTLFVSNLEFKVDEQKLRDILSQYGEIESLRLKAGVKAFGGSICYCQYKSTRCVDEALKHDRTPLEGRPMFFSRYSSKKGKAGFKYSTDAEKNKLFVKNLPYSHCTKDALTELFEKYGKLKDVRVVTFKDGKPKGLAYIEYEDEASASLAIEKCHGLSVGGRALDVAVSAPPPKAAPAPSLGHARAAPAHAMRRTQLSSFIPSVLQKPVASTSGNGAHSSGDKRPLSNTDFRNLLLKK